MRWSAVAVMALLSCGALTVFALLVTAAVTVQLGPGGLLSTIRPGEAAPDFEVAMAAGRSPAPVPTNGPPDRSPTEGSRP